MYTCTADHACSYYYLPIYIIIIMTLYCFCRGKTFRMDYDRLGELRSVLPSPVPVMALTATSSCEVYSTAIAVLGMHQPCLISAPPNKNNLYFQVIPKKELFDIAKDIAIQFHAIAKDDPKLFPKTVVFCKR